MDGVFITWKKPIEGFINHHLALLVTHFTANNDKNVGYSSVKRCPEEYLSKAWSLPLSKPTSPSKQEALQPQQSSTTFHYQDLSHRKNHSKCQVKQEITNRPSRVLAEHHPRQKHLQKHQLDPERILVLQPCLVHPG
jgi:hypothetical protein